MNKPRLQTGAALQAGALYIERPADQELFDALRLGELCYILAPRQIGKSSLRVHTSERLERAGVRCATIDLQKLGTTTVTESQWYHGLLTILAKALLLGKDGARAFWRDHESLSPVHRFSLFLREYLLARVPEPAQVVIFVDEIDQVLSLPFSRYDFFAAIRAAYNARAEDPAYERLTFCLIGVAAPGDLMQDPSRTPFNVGRGVRCEDFSAGEAEGFLPALLDLGPDPRGLLRAVMSWTDGNPYMTQRVLQALPQGADEGRVAEVVKELFLLRPREESNLEHARDRFEREVPEAAMPQKLDLYRRLLFGRRVVADGADRVQMELRLAGMVKEYRDGGTALLRVRNRIFAQVFNDEWLRSKDQNQYLTDSVTRWLESGERDDFLLRGKLLEEAVRWANENEGQASPDKKEFIRRGLEVALREAEEKQAAAEGLQKAEEAVRLAERTRAINLRRGAIGLAGLVLLLLISLLKTCQLNQKLLTASEKEKSARQAAEKASQAEKAARQAAEKASQAEKAARQAAEKAKGETEVKAREAQMAKDLAEERRQLAEEGEKQAREQSQRAEEAQRLAQQRADVIAKLTAEKAEAQISKERAGFAVELGAKALRLVSDQHRTAEALSAAIIAVGPSVDHNQDPPKKAVDGLLAALQATSKVELGEPAAMETTRFSPDGRLIVTVRAERPGGLSIQGGKLITITPAERAAQLWDGRTGAPLSEIRGLSERIGAAAFSPDGQRLVLASLDGTARVWNIEHPEQPSAEPRAILTGHRWPIVAVNFSPSGKRIVTSSWDYTARLWDSESGRELAVMEHTAGVVSAVFSVDGEHIVTASADRSACLWDAETGRLVRKLEGHDGPVFSAEFSGDGSRVVTASEDGTARLWNVDGRGPHLTLRGHEGRVNHAEFSPDGQRVLTAGEDGTARVWDALSGKLLVIMRDSKRSIFGRGLHAAAFSSDGAYVVTTNEAAMARVWNSWSGVCLDTHEGRRPAVWSASFAPGSQRVLVGSTMWWPWPSSARPLSLTDNELGPVVSVAVSPFIGPFDAHLTLIAGPSGNAKLWRGSEAVSLDGHRGSVWSAAFSPDVRLIVTASEDGTARVWDRQTGKTNAILRGHTGPIHAAAFAPDSEHLVTAGDDRTVRLWRAGSGECLAVLIGHQGPVNSAVFSPDGRLVVSGSNDGTARLWDGHTGAPRAVLQEHQGPVNTAVFSPDGHTIATAGDDSTARLWDVHSSRRLSILSGHQARVVSALFSGDGARVITASKDGTARIFSTATGIEIGKLADATGGINDARFSPDGLRAVTASDGHSVSLWSVRGTPARLLASYRRHRGWVRSAVFSPDGRWIYSGSGDGSAGAWPGSVEVMKEYACRRVSTQMEAVPEQDRAKVREYCHLLTPIPPRLPGPKEAP